MAGRGTPAAMPVATTCRQAAWRRAMASRKKGSSSRLARSGSRVKASWMDLRKTARMMQPPFQMRASSARGRFQPRCAEALRSRAMPWA